MIRNLYDWTLALAAHPSAVWALALISFIEASFFPIPPDVMLIPMIIAAPQRAWTYAGVALISSVLGGICGYGIGMFAYEVIGQPILEALGKADAMAEFSQRFNDYGFWTVITAGVTPLPFKVITIMSGATAMPFGMFILAAITARAIRFFVVALLLYYFGAPIRTFIERWLGWLFLLFIIVLVAGFWGIQYL
jgi:membrane protein YqaA with SNARE-associated domain